MTDRTRDVQEHPNRVGVARQALVLVLVWALAWHSPAPARADVAEQDKHNPCKGDWVAGRSCSSCGAGMDSGTTQACPVGPVNLLTGAVGEEKRDLSVPNAASTWGHSRSYGSNTVSTDSGHGLAYEQGRFWKVALLGSLVKQNGSGANVSVFIGAQSKEDYTYSSISGHTATYTPPADLHTNLKHYRVTGTVSGMGDGGDPPDGSTDIKLVDADGGFTADAFIGCVLKVTLSDGSVELRTITDNETDSITVGIAFSKDLDGLAYEVLGQFVLRVKSSGRMYRFRDCNLTGYTSGWGDQEQSRLWKATNVYATDYVHYTYSEAVIEAGRVESMVMSNGRRGEYTYKTVDPNGGRFGELEVYADVEDDDPTADEVISGVLYTYFEEGYDTDNGSDGDLLLVQVCEVVSLAGTANTEGSTTVLQIKTADRDVAVDALIGYRLVMRTGDNEYHVRKISDNSAIVEATPSGSITVSTAFPNSISENDKFWVAKEFKATHYRYYKNADSDGQDNQIKHVFEPDAVERLVDANATLKDPFDLLGKADDFTVTGSLEVSDYASQAFTYYESDLNTNNNVTTPWMGSQNLSTLYGGSNFNEGTKTVSGVDRGGFCKTMTVRGACGGCGGSGTGVKHTYFYMDLHGGPDADPELDEDVVTRIVVEDLTATETTTDDVKIRRVIHGLNRNGVELRTVTIVNEGTQESPSYKFWCRSTVVRTTGSSENQPTAERMPSAQTVVDTEGEVDESLDPTPGTNDADTLYDCAWVIYTHSYST
ncbi:MAG: hypothetical protein ABIF82_12695, partial [Planctomycetota bacterium]